MTICNQCGARMVPDETAVVPALRCTNIDCARIIPRPGTKAATRATTRAQVNRVMRAARRHKRRESQ